MQLIPDPQNSRSTAILLLIVALIVVYMLGFHWFVNRHLEYADEIAGLREQLERFQLVAAQKEALQEQLAMIREARDDAQMFLGEKDFNEAAAAMADRLGRMVQTQAEESCQIVSRQPVRSRVQQRFEQVTVNVRMRCNGEDLLKILHRLESGMPMVIVDDVNILRPRVRRRVGGKIVEVAQELDVRFNISGYLRS